MPNYVCRMFFRKEKGVAAVLYGPAVLEAEVGDSGTKVRINAETNYPFEETIEFTFETPRPVTFPFFMRIPGWCSGASVEVNGETVANGLDGSQLFKLEREFATHDKVTLKLPMEIRIVTVHPAGVGVAFGPLAYALDIKERWEIDVEHTPAQSKLPYWNCYPESPWNYALNVSDQAMARYQVHRQPATGYPWDKENAPVVITAPGRRVKGWSLREESQIHRGLHFVDEDLEGEFTFTPDLPEQENLEDHLVESEETVRLVPYGATCLRLSVFPWYAR